MEPSRNVPVSTGRRVNRVFFWKNKKEEEALNECVFFFLLREAQFNWNCAVDTVTDPNAAPAGFEALWDRTYGC
jgi:hypothetical protein